MDASARYIGLATGLYWENLALVVVLALESKAIQWHAREIRE